MRASRTILIGAMPFLFACPGFGDEGLGFVPDEPTYVDHVKPILDANCIVCHVNPPQNGAPVGFRLDQYADEKDGLGNVIAFGAGSFGCLVKIRAADQAPTAMPPPPRAPVTETEKAILTNWAATGRREMSVSTALEPCF